MTERKQWHNWAITRMHINSAVYSESLTWYSTNKRMNIKTVNCQWTFLTQRFANCSPYPQRNNITDRLLQKVWKTQNSSSTITFTLQAYMWKTFRNTKVEKGFICYVQCKKIGMYAPTVFILMVLKSFKENLFMTKSSDRRSDLITGHTCNWIICKFFCEFGLKTHRHKYLATL